MTLENALCLAAAAAFAILLLRLRVAAVRRYQITAAERGILVEVVPRPDLAASELIVTNGSVLRLWNVSVKVYELWLTVMNLDDTHMSEIERNLLSMPSTEARDIGPGESVGFRLEWDVKECKRMTGSCFAGFSFSKSGKRIHKVVRYMVRGT
jgi:hypothetical protein